MDKKLIEDVAQAIQRQHGKEMLGEIQKWEKRTPEERSSWRLVARTAINVIEGARAPAPSKPAAPASRAKAKAGAR